MKMRDLIDLSETYSRDNAALLQYMKAEEVDPWSLWYHASSWLEENYPEETAELLSGEPYSLHEQEPDFFYRYPKHIQEECAKEIVEIVAQDDPAEAPTWHHMSLTRQKLLPRQTWLVHFSNDADDIAQQGFKIGMQDMTKLGLTTWTNNDSYEKSGGGFNFAFLANSRFARNAASRGRYGRHAVLFQNSGVIADHHGDEEEQVMFWGSHVNPKSIIELRNDGGEWCVMTKRDLPNGKDELFRGEFEDAVKWAIQNHQQYRRYL